MKRGDIVSVDGNLFIVSDVEIDRAFLSPLHKIYSETREFQNEQKRLQFYRIMKDLQEIIIQIRPVCPHCLSGDNLFKLEVMSGKYKRYYCCDCDKTLGRVHE